MRKQMTIARRESSGSFQPSCWNLFGRASLVQGYDYSDDSYRPPSLQGMETQISY